MIAVPGGRSDGARCEVLLVNLILAEVVENPSALTRTGQQRTAASVKTGLSGVLKYLLRRRGHGLVAAGGRFPQKAITRVGADEEGDLPDRCSSRQLESALHEAR